MSRAIESTKDGNLWIEEQPLTDGSKVYNVHVFAVKLSCISLDRACDLFCSLRDCTLDFV